MDVWKKFFIILNVVKNSLVVIFRIYTSIPLYFYTSFFLFISSIAFADFTLGIYGVNDINEIPAIKQAGFNTVQTYNQNPEYISALAEKAKQYDMKLLVFPNKIIGSKYEDEAHNYPMNAWYICDEPDVNHLSREKMIELDGICKKTFPEHQTAFVIGQGKTKISFYDICDILMMDWYPVPHLPLESFGENVALAKQGLIDAGCPDKPLWGVVQIFDWKEFKQFRPDNDRIGRFPTKEEIRFMSYDALFNGATGLFYFVYRSKGVPLPQSRPEEWKYISEVIQELSFIGKIIDGGKEIKNPVKIKNPLKSKTYEYGGERYIIMENPSGQIQKFSRKFFNQKKFKVLFEESSNLGDIIQKNKNFLSPYRVLILQYKK